MKASTSTRTTSIMIVQLLLLLLSLSLSSCAAMSSGIQSGPSPGSFYAGGMVFDKGDDVLYMTGIHYNNDIIGPTDNSNLPFSGTDGSKDTSSCFITSVRFNGVGGDTESNFDDGIDDWKSDIRIDESNQETCTSLTVQKPSQLIVMGSKETTNTRNIPSEGMMSVIDKNNLNDLLTETTLVGIDNPSTELVYPVSVTTDSNNNDYIYFASLTSTDAIENTSASANNKKYPDWLKYQRYGSSFDFHVTKLKVSYSDGVDEGGDFDGISTGSITASKEWTTEFPLDPSNETPAPRVYIGGIIHKQTNGDDGSGLLIVVGSTRGTGAGYGRSEGDDEDGFVTVIDPTTGEFLGDGVREGSAEDDIVTGICDDPTDPNHFFVVGATEGNMGNQQADSDADFDSQGSLQPFVRQVKTDRSSSDADNIWTMQWTVLPAEGNGGRAFGSAMGCVVVGEYIYVAGTVDGGASIVQGSSIKKSQGGDDVWITKINKSTQQVEWMTQLGSTGNDRLARYGGITMGNSGNPIIYGDTTGSMYRQRSEAENIDIVEDMFVMNINANTGDVFRDSNFIGGTSTNDGIDDGGGDGNGMPTLLPTFFPSYLGDDDDNDISDPTEAPTMEGDNVNDYLDDLFKDDDDDVLKVDDNDDDDDIFVTDDLVAQIENEIEKEQHFYIPIGLQIAGPAYAGGIAYDSYDNTALLAGATYMDASLRLNPSSLCFTGVVDLNNGDLIVRTPRGSNELEEACNAITFDTNRNAAYAIGVAETDEQGQFTDVGIPNGNSWQQGQSDAEAGGMILQLNENVQLLGGNNIVDYPAVYPVSVVTHPRDKDYLFVASMATKRTSMNAESTLNDFPNFLDRDNRKYGSEFFLMINRYKVNNVPKQAAPAILENDQVPNTLDKDWFNDFRVDNGGTLSVGGMVMAGNGNILVVVGSTRDSGGPFEQNDGGGDGDMGLDMDGFILKVNPEDGKLAESTNGSKSSTRLDSVNKKDDWILNVCNDRFDHDAFYVVGKSKGKIRDIADDQQPPEGSIHAYVAKVDLRTLGATWLKHFTMKIPNGGPVSGEALACTVTPDSNGRNIVYVGGTIKDGAEMDGQANDEKNSFGNDDIFVASMDGATGEVNWIQQMGTSENDRLATGQGLDVDSFGNVIVFAETGGNFYDKHEGNADAPDLVVLTVNKKTGSYLSPMTQGEGVGNNNPDDITANNNDMVGDVLEPDSIVAVQTEYPDGPSYAGGMYYDSYTNAVYVTGATYESPESSRCFFAIATLPRLYWKQEEIYGTSKAPEACSAISLTNYNGKSEAIIVGSSEKSGLLDDLRTARRAEQYGIVLDLANNGGIYELIGGTVVDDEKVQYPVQVITNNNEQVFVLSMASVDDKVSADFDKADSKKFPNFTTGGIEKYGSQYEILVERHTINRADDMPPGSMDSTMNLDWRKPLETADQKSIYVSGMALIDNGSSLVVVGSTKASSGDGDFDGIMAKVTTENGSFASGGDESRTVAYFSSVGGKDDWILNVCTDSDDDNFFYIVGATGDEMDVSVNKSDEDVTVHAIVSKITTDTLEILWTTQFAVTHSSGSTKKEAASVALGCAVIPGQGRIYVAGNVENGAILEGSTESAGGDDIFVAMLETGNGDKIWTKQVGSDGDDRIARGGGIASDANGNAVVYGDTTGDFHRIRNNPDPSKQYSDFFLMIFNQEDGANKPSLSKQSSNPNDISNESASAPSEWFGPNGSGDNTAMYKDPKFLSIIIGALVLLLLIIFCVFFMRYRMRRLSEINKKKGIFTYLQQFSVEDIDLRKSPPGGWHGTYLNQLSHGVNTAAQISESPYKDEEDEDEVLFESAKMVHSSSVVDDSLFTDNATAPVLGGEDQDDSDYAVGNEDDILATKTDDRNGKRASFSIV